MPLYGIDVSKYQGKINWDQVKASGVCFVMIRAGYGQNNIDEYFRRNAAECRRVGLPFGMYWFSYAYTPDMAVREARYCTALAEEYKPSYPLAYDLEYDTVRYAKEQGTVIGKTLATQLAQSFCNTIKKAGYIPMVYMNLDYYKNMFEISRLPYELWYAQYASKPSVKGMALWQYSSSGKVPGIAGDCDLNYGYKDFSGSGQGEDYGEGDSSGKEGGSGEVEYTVQPGDTLSEIAEKYGTTVSALSSVNGISDPDRIYAGQSLKIPRASENYYIVRQGDTLSGIAEKYGTTYQALASANGISDPNKIYPGQRILIPKRGGGYYTIRPGDTLSGIASKYGTTTAQLQSWNHISDPDRIYAGNTIRVR